MFVSNINSFVKLIFYSELTWIILYVISLVYASINDDLNLLSFSIFILSFAGIEYAIGLVLLLIFKDVNGNLIFSETNNKNYFINFFKKKNFFLNKYNWKLKK